MMLSWLSVLVMLTSVLGWLPAAARDATPVPADPASEQIDQPRTTSLQDDGSDSGEETTTDQQLFDADTPIEITSVSVDCGTDATTVTGSFSVSNPRDDASVELQMVAGETVLRSLTVPLDEDESTFAFDFTLEPDDSTAGESVVVTAREEGADTSPVTSSSLAISRTAGGETVCGAAPSPTATTTPTASATSTPTPTGSPTPSPTPDDEMIRQLVEELVRILEEVLASPTPADPPTQGGNDPAPTPVDPPDGPTQDTFGAVVNTNGYSLRCRTEPVDGATIMLIPLGTRVEVRGDPSNGWVPVVCNGEDGWVSTTYFRIEGSGSPDPAPEPDGESRTAMVTGTGGAGLRCRTAPVSGEVITVLPEGAEVETRGGITDGWAPVRCNGQDGWSSAAYLIFDGGGGSGELWIDIDLGSQYMRVYRGDTVIRGTYVSTGRPGFDTPTGTYYILVKYPSDDMEGVLGGEYYNVPNVPWTMYFTNRGHAIHGAYWHDNFGQVMSHGCVNAPVPFAEWLYSITPLGTRVRIHY